jgi:ribosomal protein S4E
MKPEVGRFVALESLRESLKVIARGVVKVEGLKRNEFGFVLGIE